MKGSPKYYYSVVAIFKNEHRYIKQWLEYHVRAGVDHFYMYDNGGDHWEEIKEYADRMTYVPWTDDLASGYIKGTKFSRQTGAYTHCLEQYGQETQWLQLLDLDEFVVPLESPSIQMAIESMEPARKMSVLRVPRFNFGNSGHWFSPSNQGILAFVRRERTSSHFKDAGDPSHIERVKNPHMFAYKEKRVLWAKGLAVHHHYTRTLPEWMARAQTGGGQAGKGFRWLIGRKRWLAYLTYLFLNIPSVAILIALLICSLLLIILTLHPALWSVVVLLAFWLPAAWRRGQNEVQDCRLREVWGD